MIISRYATNFSNVSNCCGSDLNLADNLSFKLFHIISQKLLSSNINGWVWIDSFPYFFGK